MTEFERRKDLVNYLYENRFSSRQALAMRYDVSSRTIDRDVLYLCRFYPIYTKSGPGGGVFIKEGAELYEHLTPEQQSLLERLIPSLEIEDAKTLESIITEFGRR